MAFHMLNLTESFIQVQQKAPVSSTVVFPNGRLGLALIYTHRFMQSYQSDCHTSGEI